VVRFPYFNGTAVPYTFVSINNEPRRFTLWKTRHEISADIYGHILQCTRTSNVCIRIDLQTYTPAAGLITCDRDLLIFLP